MNLNWLIPRRKGIPVLMYHRVWPDLTDDLTITPERLRDHWQFLKEDGYHTLSLPEYLDIINGKSKQPQKAILITFDDGYRNNLEYAYPLLKEFGWQATFFITGNMIDGAGEENEKGVLQKMTLPELHSLDPAVVQLGIHGYVHEDMSRLTLQENGAVLRNAVKAFDTGGLSYYKVWAYPYGKRPGKNSTAIKKIMADSGFKAAFRIGNQVSAIPPRDLFEIKRIDIKGTDDLNKLKIKLIKGKLKPF